MAAPYLILHKVRGQPAFDIAELIEEGPLFDCDGPWWVVSTSGHRAYPYWHMVLESLLDWIEQARFERPPMPDPWPDHYSPREAPAVLTTAALSLLESIGLGPKPIKRRKVE